ncbi:lytic transglycosylase domain-containing protein [Sphingomonas sp. 1185]|uniref:lytic transglycosylase domain-containing protein n=1 Tax=Sphingomonas sp. 1185 TaxID=3156411 RepID=UPI00339774C9
MRHSPLVFRYAAIAFMMLFSSPCAASRHGTIAEERLIARCIRRAALGRPWLEKTLWGLRDQEGGWIGAAVRNRNGTYDLGPFQINSWWVPKIAAELDRDATSVAHWLRHDPCFNAEAARWIYLTGLNSDTSYWRAIGQFHSPVHWRQQRYAASVAFHLHMRFGGQIFER